MHPEIPRDLARLGQLNHMHRRRIATLAARSAFQCRFKFPDWRIPRPADGIERKARPRLTAIALHLEPAESAIETLRDRRRRLRRPAVPSIRIDQASASARSASRIAFLAASRAPSARIFASRILLPKMTSRD